MYLLEVSLLLFLSTNVHTSYTEIPKVWQPNTIDKHKNCICYPEGPSPTIQHVLDPQNKGLERLVVYFYKSVGSNEIKMYTPNVVKQALLPDLPYEASDGLLTVITERVSTIFNNSPHRVNVYNNRFATVKPPVTDSWPIGLNSGAVENIYPNDGNGVQPSHGYKGNEYNNDIPPKGYVVAQTEQIKHSPAIAIPNKGPSPGEYGNEIPEAIKDLWWSNKVKYSSSNVYPNNGGPKDLIYALDINDGAIAVPPGSSTLNLEAIPTFTMWYNQEMKKFQNIHLPNDIKVLEHISLRVLVQQTLAENNIHVSADGVMIDSNGVVIDAANLELRPLLIGDKIEQEIFKTSFNKIIIPKNLQYLEGILVTLVNPPKMLGIIPLGKTYLPEFPSLGNSVNDYVKDYGIANLVSYSSVSEGPLQITANDAYSGLYRNPVSTRSSYVYSDGIKGLTYSDTYSNGYTQPLASSYSYSSTDKVPYSGTSEVSYWNSGPYSDPNEPTKWTPLPNTQVVGKRRTLSGAKIEHHYEPPILKKLKEKIKGRFFGKSKKPIEAEIDKSKINTKPAEPLADVNSLESGRRSGDSSVSTLKSAMKTLLHLLDTEPSGRDFGSGTNSTETDDIVNGSESLNGGDRPDFRIIGGNAATGSGTPLNNKGRSGYEEYI